MAFDGLLITEIFHSLQGETSLTGVPFVFIRLTGCNLRCSYCDSAYSFKGGKRMSVEAVLDAISPYQTRHVLVTGGEPLIQRNTPALIRALQEKGYDVSVETHGEAPIEAVSRECRIVLDIKTPGSGMNRSGHEANLKFLKPGDEIKFVITSESDYEWAKAKIRSLRGNPAKILFSPALPAKGSPGTFPGVHPRDLADWILRDQLQVRFQIQLHKYLWGADTKGV
jgi:7-carboxy-7-deazaguanine synthase